MVAIVTYFNRAVSMASSSKSPGLEVDVFDNKRLTQTMKKTCAMCPLASIFHSTNHPFVTETNETDLRNVAIFN